MPVGADSLKSVQRDILIQRKVKSEAIEGTLDIIESFKIQNLHESHLSAKSFSSLGVIIQWLAFKSILSW